MTHKLKRRLEKLSNKQFSEDIKKYIRSPYEFYKSKVPEMNILAKRLHEEHDLKGFYKIFNKLWVSGYNEEMSLAIKTLELYKDNFNESTWRFIKPKLKELKSWDQIDTISTKVLGELLIKYPKLNKEIIKLAKNKNVWQKRIAIMSTIPLIKKGKLKLTMHLAEILISNRDEPIQKSLGKVLCQAGKKNPELIKRFILKYMQMSEITFMEATENMKELRKIRKLKKLAANQSKRFFLWRIKR